MRRLICFVLAFCLLFFCCYVPVYADNTQTDELFTAAQDISSLTMSEDGKYWIYFHFYGDNVRTVDGSGTESFHQVDFEIYADVTSHYRTYGIAGLFFIGTDTDSLNDKFHGRFLKTKENTEGVLSPGSVLGASLPVRVSGTFDGEPFSFDSGSKTVSFSDFDLALLMGINSHYYVTVDGNGSFYVDYLPYYGNVNTYWDVFNYSYRQAPVYNVPIPQQPVFAFDSSYGVINFDDDIWMDGAGDIRGIKMVLRYPYSVPEDFYKKQNLLSSVPLVGSLSVENVTTYVDYRITCLVDGEEVSTPWVNIGNLPYSSNSFEYLLNSAQGSLDAFSYGIGVLNGFTINHLTMRIDQLPSLLRSFGVHVPSDSKIILTKVEAAAQNYDSKRLLWSDIVFSEYDLNKGSVTTDVIPDTDDNGHTITEVVDGNGSSTIIINITLPSTTGNDTTTITPGTTPVVPGVNGDGSSGVGSSDFGDSLLQFFQFILDILGTLITGFIKVLRLVMSLIGDVVALAGDVPKLFGFLFTALPPEFGTLFMLGLILGLIGIARGR